MNLEAPKKGVPLLERARRYLSKCPPAISGQHGHNTTFRVACALVHGFALSGEDAQVLIREWNARCQPPWSEEELVHKINSALGTPGKCRPGHLVGRWWGGSLPGVRPGRSGAWGRPEHARKPEFAPDILKRVAARVGEVNAAFIQERSPICVETQTPASFLQHLYLPGEQVLVFDHYKSQGLHVCECTKPPYDARLLNHLRNGCKDGVWFLCNPVDGKFHPNPRLGGKRSRRSEESVTAWRYLVLESDEADATQWLGVLVQIPLRIAAIYTSGGRSIHALVRVDATCKADWDGKATELKPIVITLGADPKNITGVRLTRLPFCHRGQTGPRAPQNPLVYPRRVDEPLEFDDAGDPIWIPKAEPSVEPAAELWSGGTLQELLYLDPNPDGEPICRKATRQAVFEQWLASFAK